MLLTVFYMLKSLFLQLNPMPQVKDKGGRSEMKALTCIHNVRQ